MRHAAQPALKTKPERLRRGAISESTCGNRRRLRGVLQLFVERQAGYAEAENGFKCGENALGRLKTQFYPQKVPFVQYLGQSLLWFLKYKGPKLNCKYGLKHPNAAPVCEAAARGWCRRRTAAPCFRHASPHSRLWTLRPDGSADVAGVPVHRVKTH